MMMSHQMGVPAYCIQHPDVVQHLATTKNNQVDKNGEGELIFKEMLGNSFLLSKGDELWKKKRKACAHAFYKDKLDAMLEVLKKQTRKRFSFWFKQMEEKGTDFAKIDITYEFERLFSRNMVEISFGEDVSDNRFEIYVFKNKDTQELMLKKVSIREAISTINQMLMLTFGTKAANPINWQGFYTGKMFNFTYMERIMGENCRRIRSYINDYVQGRKEGRNKTKLDGDSDLLNLFLENPDIFTNDFIIDELLDFFLAGMVTTMSATQTMLCHFIKDPKSLKRVRDEFEKIVAGPASE